MTKNNLENLQATSIPVSYTGWITRALGKADITDLLSGSGLTSGQLTDENIKLTPQQQFTILKNAIRISGDPDFCLKLGQMLTPASHGPLGFLMLSSPNLQMAINAFVRFLPTRIPFIEFRVKTHGEQLIAHVDMNAELSDTAYRYFMEACIVSLQTILEHILGRPLCEATGEFGYPDPKLNYDHFLHFPVSFGAPATRFTLPLSLARTANIAADPDSFAFAQQQCQQQLSALEKQQSFSKRVQILMLSTPADQMTERQIADSLFITRRTLSRRLQKEGTSFRQLRDRHLYFQAKGYLKHTNLSVAAIAEILDYHDNASFRRAFKRWSGLTPKLYRQSNTEDE